MYVRDCVSACVSECVANGITAIVHHWVTNIGGNSV